jgi:hypothetical protein
VAKFLYIIAKLQAGLPLSALERDIVLRAVREQWLTKKEHAAFLRQAELKQIEATRRVAKRAKNLKGKREGWVRKMHDFPTPEAMKQFIKRERKHRR